MRELAYIPNRAARSLVVNRLGVLPWSFPTSAIRSFRSWPAALRPRSRRGLSPSSSAIRRTIRQGRRLSPGRVALRVDGVLLVPCGQRSRESLALLARQRIPVVLIDRDVDGIPNDVVRGESRRSAAALTRHLIEHGHQRIGVITGPADI